MESFSELLETFYSARDDLERSRRRTQVLSKLITNARDRVSRRIAAQQEELKSAQERDRLRQLGDILSANLYTLERGMETARLMDFFDQEGKEIEIKMDVRLTPQQNAALYYKRYARAKNAYEKLMEQLAQGRTELDYLESVLEELSRCSSIRDLAEIRQELADSGYVSRQASAQKGRIKTFNPLTFKSSSGIHFYAGRNNRQNDMLTMKFASKTDVWLHVHLIHGCHVIVDSSQGEPDDRTLTEAASIAAFYSQGRDSQNVPVDYTIVKNVKKPPSSKPGMVIYDHYKTAFVTPDAALAEKLMVKESR
jgi:predicted ribosome quality control (RQC) complex YloA/Tae2 family protein